MSFETIETRMDKYVAVITLNRPDVLNAVNAKLTEEVKQAMDGFGADPKVRAIVLNGAGRAFSAGFDMKETAEKTNVGINEWQEILERDFDFIMRFWDCPKPTVAAVHGYCLAGAFELALACDVTVAAEGTRFGEPEVRFGAGIVAMLLPWMTGPKQAKELLLTGNDQIDAADALAMGVINHVVPAGEEFDKAMSIAKDMSAAAAAAVQATKRAINRTYEIMGMRQALLAALESDLVITVAGGPDKDEFNRLRRDKGLKAALAWRDAKFR
ncbi:MAG: enoyl-CoA hydratase/isomerase family protein [Rhodospirillales bacterium]|jgi:enoyl-CoA hydratase|nr:enoyl-CoA hydratase/isomerase family protein [Rhodospirillales bacterium]MDP7241921.1 enoyl-CoA hydratase/isomerase family protein [Rhodospirillales bacterium]